MIRFRSGLDLPNVKTGFASTAVLSPSSEGGRRPVGGTACDDDVEITAGNDTIAYTQPWQQRPGRHLPHR